MSFSAWRAFKISWFYCILLQCISTTFKGIKFDLPWYVLQEYNYHPLKGVKNHHLLWCILLEYNSHLGRCKILHKIVAYFATLYFVIIYNTNSRNSVSPIEVIFYIPTLSVAIHITTLFCIGNSHPSGSTVMDLEAVSLVAEVNNKTHTTIKTTPLGCFSTRGLQLSCQGLTLSSMGLIHSSSFDALIRILSREGPRSPIIVSCLGRPRSRQRHSVRASKFSFTNCPSR